MINFRFHLISLVAVFLALGLGIVVGSTVVDDAIVDQLERDIDEVRTESRRLGDENDGLRDQLATVERYTEATAPFAVEGRLADVPVAVIAERGVDSGEVTDAVDLLRAAGAEVPGILWLEEPWKLEQAEQLNALKEATGATGSKVAARALALDTLANRLDNGPPVAVEGEEPPPDLIAVLRDAGFLGFDGDEGALASFPSRPARTLLVTGTRSDLRGADITLIVARVFADAGEPTVVAEVFAEGGDQARIRGGVIAPIRADDNLSAEVSTVDDLDLVEGRVTAVLALENVATGVVGHYGYGAGANAPLPDAPR